MKYYPMTFNPVFKQYMWGGRNLEKLGRVIPEGIVAESWDISAHEDGMATVENGIYAGKKLSEVQQELGLGLIGTNNTWAQERGKFPLLIKLLDAHKPLSVQVHPDDAYALANVGNELGKTEMWVVLQAEPDAELILGVKTGTSPDLFRQAIQDGDLERYLHRIKVKVGDHICVPARSVHAIMGGLVMVEIQQNSNTTYRVYDWNRTDKDGRSRPLHIDRAMDVINFDQIEPGLCPPTLIGEEAGIRRWLLCENPYFTTERIEFGKGAEYRGLCNGESLEIWGVIDGSVDINGLELSAVRFTLLPAGLGEFHVQALTEATLLRVYTSSPAV